MCSVITDSGRIYLRLLSFVRPHWRVFALAIGAMLGLASTEWMLPALLKPLIDQEFEIAGKASFSRFRRICSRPPGELQVQPFFNLARRSR